MYTVGRYDNIYTVLGYKLLGDLVLWRQQMRIQDFIGETTEYDKKQMLEEKRPKSWCKSVSAFANGAGGTLVFGIVDDDSIVGLPDSKHDSEIISEQIKTKLDPIPKFDLSLRRIDSIDLEIS